jgi:hypothetical protein
MTSKNPLPCALAILQRSFGSQPNVARRKQRSGGELSWVRSPSLRLLRRSCGRSEPGSGKESSVAEGAYEERRCLVLTTLRRLAPHIH